ncbi:MAG: hypothetical protein ABL888_02810 [Pirellulaceae bacterium]
MQKACGAPIATTTARSRWMADAVAVAAAAGDIAITVAAPGVAPADLAMAADSCPVVDVVARMLAAETAAVIAISVATTVASAGQLEQVAPRVAADSQIAWAMAHSSIAIVAVAVVAAVVAVIKAANKVVIQDAVSARASVAILVLVPDKTAAAAIAACPIMEINAASDAVCSTARNQILTIAHPSAVALAIN